MNTLANKLSRATLPLFDYASLHDPDLETELRASEAKIREFERAAVVDIGRELIAVKKALPEGTFLKWIEASFNYTCRTANRMMTVAAELGDAWDTVSHLQHGTLYLLAAPSTPPEVRATVLQNLGPGQIVSTANVRLMIDSVKSSELRKHRRDRREEERQERERNREKWEADAAKARRQYERETEAAREVAEQVRSWLGNYFPEACEILANVEPSRFGTEFSRLAAEFRNQQRFPGVPV